MIKQVATIIGIVLFFALISYMFRGCGSKKSSTEKQKIETQQPALSVDPYGELIKPGEYFVLAPGEIKSWPCPVGSKVVWNNVTDMTSIKQLTRDNDPKITLQVTGSKPVRVLIRYYKLPGWP